MKPFSHTLMTRCQSWAVMKCRSKWRTSWCHVKSISMIYLPEEPPRAINGVVDVELLTIRYLLRNGSARRGETVNLISEYALDEFSRCRSERWGSGSDPHISNKYSHNFLVQKTDDQATLICTYLHTLGTYIPVRYPVFIRATIRIKQRIKEHRDNSFFNPRMGGHRDGRKSLFDSLCTAVLFNRCRCPRMIITSINYINYYARIIKRILRTKRVVLILNVSLV